MFVGALERARVVPARLARELSAFRRRKEKCDQEHEKRSGPRARRDFRKLALAAQLCARVPMSRFLRGTSCAKILEGVMLNNE